MGTVSLLNKYDYLQDAEAVFNNPLSTNEVAAAGEKYILTFYTSATPEGDLSHHRFVSFTKIVDHPSHIVLLSGLPPTFTAARQHSN